MSARPLSLVASPLVIPEKETTSTQITETPVSSRSSTNLDEEYRSKEPVFLHHQAVTNIQLFFDLFVVANLNSFAEAHDVNSTTSLGTYIGYFCVLWFTWCQVSLYDVRFITDSIFERLADAVHFGVIIALSVVGQSFENLAHHPPWELLRTLSLILIVSRATLFVQYLNVLLFTWKFHKARVPAIVTLTTFILVLIVYVGIYAALKQEVYNAALVGWYVVFVFEIASSIAVASRWEAFTFKGTHLIERMTVLSLIILGEGVIGITKVIMKILKYGRFSPEAIGGIICSILIIYLIYIIYFDNVPTHHLASVRQQLWAFMHFPFHVTLVLLSEGASQFIAWRHTIEYMESSFSDLVFISDASDHAPLQKVYEAYDATIFKVLQSGPFSVSYETIQAANQNLATLTQSNVTISGIKTAITNIQLLLFSTVYDAYGFQPPDFSEHGVPAEVEQVFIAYYNVFEFLFGYFYICGGLTLIMIAGLSCISMSETGQARKWKFLTIFTNVLLGLSLCLLSLLTKTDAAFTLGASPWTITVCVFVLFIAIVVDQISKRKMMACKDEVVDTDVTF